MTSPADDATRTDPGGLPPTHLDYGRPVKVLPLLGAEFTIYGSDVELPEHSALRRVWQQTWFESGRKGAVGREVWAGNICEWVPSVAGEDREAAARRGAIRVVRGTTITSHGALLVRVPRGPRRVLVASPGLDPREDPLAKEWLTALLGRKPFSTRPDTSSSTGHSGEILHAALTPGASRGDVADALSRMGHRQWQRPPLPSPPNLKAWRRLFRRLAHDRVPEDKIDKMAEHIVDAMLRRRPTHGDVDGNDVARMCEWLDIRLDGLIDAHEAGWSPEQMLPWRSLRPEDLAGFEPGRNDREMHEMDAFFAAIRG